MRHKNPLNQGWVQAKAVRWLWGSLWGMCALGWCAAALPGAPPSAASGPARAAVISSITLERNCFGCAGASVLVLQRDGQVRYTVTGHARQGTSDQISTGKISRRDFDALTRLAVQQGFFDLQERYEDPQFQDGEWAALRIVRGSEDKQVVNRNGAGPAGLQTLERGVDAMKSRIKFTPAAR